MYFLIPLMSLHLPFDLPARMDSAIPISAPGESMLVTTSADILPIRVPTHKGLPISRIYAGPAGAATDYAHNAGQIAIQRWFALMALAAEPKWLEANPSAIVIAAAFIPPTAWPEYFTCGHRKPNCAAEVKALQSDPGIQLRLPGWKGNNKEEWAQSQRAFVGRYGKLLASQAPPLPVELYVVARANLTAFSPGKGGGVHHAEKGELPISAFGFLNGNKIADDPERRLPLAGTYTAAVRNRLPDSLTCDPRRCEEILNAVSRQAKKSSPKNPDYPVYLLVRVKVSAVRSLNGIAITPMQSGGGMANSEATVVGDISLYADKELTTHLHDFRGTAR